MQPPPRAVLISAGLSNALSALGQSLQVPQPFTPGETTRTFRLAGPDFLSNAAASLVSVVAAKAPRSRVEMVRTSASMVEDAVEGKIDAFVAPAKKVRNAQLETSRLGSLQFAVFGRRNHPGFSQWGKKAWTMWPHIMVSGPRRTGVAPRVRSPAALSLPAGDGVVTGGDVQKEEGAQPLETSFQICSHASVARPECWTALAASKLSPMPSPSTMSNPTMPILLCAKQW